jgi:hypothetical protein
MYNLLENNLPFSEDDMVSANSVGSMNFKSES